jgi:hypothetical protein
MLRVFVSSISSSAHLSWLCDLEEIVTVGEAPSDQQFVDKPILYVKHFSL